MHWVLALPEIVLSLVAMAILIFGVLRQDDSFFLSSMFALGGFLLAALLVLTTGYGIGYHGQFVADAFSSLTKILILAGAALSVILSLDYNRHNHIARFEFPVLMLLSVTGMMVMASAANLMTLYLGLELQSLALYHTRITDAGLKNLAGLSSLRTLSLGRTQVTDAGLKSLAGLKNLQSLDLSETKVTEAGVAELQKALAKVQIKR